MDYELSDSSGTDDDLPPPHQNRFQRGIRPPGNGRSAAPLPRLQGDMEAKIHLIEQEAYTSVLRAFKAQSDAITWEKESLITELRKELRVSDEEHRELLLRVNGDDIIQRLREWRKANEPQHGMLNVAKPITEPTPSSIVSASRKKRKISQSAAPLDAPSSTMAPAMQPSFSALRHGPPPGSRTKKPKSAMHHPFTGITGRAQVNQGSFGAFAVNEHGEGATKDPLIGRKVWTRWAEDNNFYEAVITDYNQLEGRHALVYDMNTVDETREWVNLKEISLEDIKWEGDEPGAAQRGSHLGQGRGGKKSMGRGGSISGAGRGRGTIKGQSKKGFPMVHNRTEKKANDDIEILHTDTLIKEVEKVFGASNLDLVEVEKAKKILKEHEQSLVDAIARLDDASDGESDEGERPFSQEQVDG